MGKIRRGVSGEWGGKRIRGMKKKAGKEGSLKKKGTC